MRMLRVFTFLSQVTGVETFFWASSSLFLKHVACVMFGIYQFYKPKHGFHDDQTGRNSRKQQQGSVLYTTVYIYYRTYTVYIYCIYIYIYNIASIVYVLFCNLIGLATRSILYLIGFFWVQYGKILKSRLNSLPYWTKMNPIGVLYYTEQNNSITKMRQ